MKAEVRALFTADTLAHVAAAVGAEPADLIRQPAFESYVHRVDRADGSIYVKSTHSSRRTQAQIRAELDFTRYLADHGADAARPISLTGDVDVIQVDVADGTFLVSAFEAAPGALLTKDTWSDAHFESWGALLGTMHRLAACEAARPFMDDRPTWQSELVHLKDYARDSRLATRYDEMITRLRSLPTTPDVFGLIHSDVHHRNVHFDGTRPTAFDFDDCTGFWYAHDLAIVMFYTLNGMPLAERNAEGARWFAALRRGYEREFSLPTSAWQTIPLFLDLREAVMWLVVERSLSTETTQGLQMWVDALLKRLVTGRPALDFDVSALTL